MKKKKKTKQIQMRHALRRCAQRYGESLTEQEYEALIAEIQAGQGTMLLRESNNKSHWFLRDKYIVVYDSNRRTIVTFIPPDAVLNYI